MINYFNSLNDEFGYTHSIDNVIVTYYLMCQVDTAIDKLRELKDKYTTDNYWERLNCAACQKWAWYQNHVHLADGIYVSLGKYQEYDKMQKKWYIFPLLKVEVNPNKHSDKPIYQAFLGFIREWCKSGYMNKHDYAIDIPLVPGLVKVYGSRKEPGLHKGTRYWGQRNNHGYLKIYDKQKESGLECPCTRIEHTLVNKMPVSFENVYITKLEGIESDLSALDSINKSIVQMIVILKQHNEDYEECIKGLNYRRRKNIEPFIAGHSERLLYDENIHKKLLDNIYEVFDIVDNVQDEVLIDSSDFVTVDGTNDLPFL